MERKPETVLGYYLLPNYMKTIYTIMMLVAWNFCYSQGEIIFRKTKAGKDFNLKILEVKNDSITYKYFGKKRTIPLSSVIAYRVNFNTDEFTFPNPKDKEIYAINNNIAINKGYVRYELKDKEKSEYIDKLLKRYELGVDSFKRNTLNKKIVLQSPDSSKLLLASPKRQLYVILKNDSLNIELQGKVFKITNDSILYLSRRMKQENHFYAINKNDIKYIGIESRKSFTKRMVLGTTSCMLVPILPCTFIPIYIFSHPTLTQYDVETKWRLKFTKQ
jgi:hypothetical protein